MMPYKFLPTVAIVGRANVGKSTLFNCLIEKRKALVSKIPGTTRDRNYGICSWRGKIFNLIDTGGLVRIELTKKHKRNLIEEKIIEQVKIALREADLILFVVDGQTTIFPQDKEIASLLRKEKKPVILVVNKMDNPRLRKMIDPNILRLGFKSPILVSALNGSGTGDLLDNIVKLLKIPEVIIPEEEKWIKISIIGKPNVGKSSLLNSILGEEKVIVSEIPHTTREPQDTLIMFKDQPILLVDTAGIRRKAKIKNFVEKDGVRLSLNSLRESDIVLLVIEIDQPIAKQDKRLTKLAIDLQKSIIFIANKWDLIPLPRDEKKYRDYILSFFSSLEFVPIIFTSAKTGFNVEKILPLVLKIDRERKKEIAQDKLDRLLKKIEFPLPRKKKFAKIYSLTQTSINPPNFVLTVNKKELLPSAFVDIVKKTLRKEFIFLGTPINVGVRVKRR